MEIDLSLHEKSKHTTVITRLLPDATIFRSVSNKKIDEFVNVITSDEQPTGGNLKYSFERFNNSEFLNKFRNMRDLKDEATKSYVNTFLAKIDDLKRFVMFMYQFLYYEILVNINSELTKQYNKKIDESEYILSSLPLQKNEKIILYFKGGTTMHLIYNLFLSNINSDEQKTKINSELKSKFSPSDTDMGIEIVCDTTKRFIIIKNALSSIITRTFDKIGYMFDFLLNNGSDGSDGSFDIWLASCKSDKIISGYFNSIELQSIKFSKTSVKIETIISELQHCKELVYAKNYTEILQIFKKYAFINESRQVVIPDNPVICGILIEFINYANLIHLNKELNTRLMSLKLSLELGAKHNLFELYKSIFNMYSKSNKDTYLLKLHTVFNSGEFKYPEGSTKNIYHESFNGTDKLIRRRQYDIPRTAIQFSTRNNFAINAIDDPYYTGVVTSFIPNGEGLNKSHYISVNNSILVDSNNIKIDFSLFRIKLLLEIDDNNSFEYINKLSHNTREIQSTGQVKRILIPSEILDVSIAGKTDTGHCIVINEKNHLDEISFQINDRLSLNLITYSTKNHINDLNQILFKQCMFTPWLDAKYAKRIDRLVFFIMLHMHQNQLSGLEPYTKLLKILKQVITNITVHEKTINNETIKIYECNKEVIKNFSQNLLEYVNNKSDYNFLVLTRKIKYVYTNVPYLYFDIYNLSHQTDFNYFELLINCCLLWTCLLFTEKCVDNFVINESTNEIEITSVKKVDLINILHKKNAMYIVSDMQSDAIINYNIQKYLEFLHTVATKITLLEPFFDNSITDSRVLATMNVSRLGNSSIQNEISESANNIPLVPQQKPTKNTQKRKIPSKSSSSNNL